MRSAFAGLKYYWLRISWAPIIFGMLFTFEAFNFSTNTADAMNQQASLNSEKPAAIARLQDATESPTPTGTTTSAGTLQSSPSASQTATLTLTTTPTFPVFPTYTPTFTSLPTTHADDLIDQTLTLTTTLSLTATTTLIPFPSVTFVYPETTQSSRLQSIQRPPGSLAFEKQSKFASIIHLWPLVIIGLVWIVLATWILISSGLLSRKK
jgi:hypothetical protein